MLDVGYGFDLSRSYGSMVLLAYLLWWIVIIDLEKVGPLFTGRL